jgi:hypothetical protein
MRERERLARIFGIEPLRPLGASALAGLMALLGTPVLWIASGTVTTWLVAIFVDEQRKIRDGLAEVNRWGFPVSGYREWLLALEPAFDLELERDVAIELLEGSLRAVDATIVIERRGERVVRVVMRRIEIRGGGEGVPTFLAGDRKRLAELCDRVLAPLHADVGIAEMRMGDRESLGALVATAAKDRHEGSAFRDQAKAAPPDLQSLVHAGTANLRPPREANALDLRVDRLLYATGQHPSSAGAMSLAVGGLAVVGMIVAPLGVLIGAAAGSGFAVAMRRNDHARVQRALEVSRRWPFPVEGYDDWLLSGRPLCDIEFASAPDHAEVERKLRAVARVAELVWLNDKLLRLESQPVMHSAEKGIMPFWGGDPRELQQIVRVVHPSPHAEHPVVAIRMGGYLDRRV